MGKARRLVARLRVHIAAPIRAGVHPMRVRMVVVYALLCLSTVAAVAWVGAQSQDQTEKVAVGSAQDLRESQLAGCQRSRDDRLDSIRGWTAARAARLRTARNRMVPIRERLQAAAAAAVYKDVIEGFTRRLVNCQQAFPPVSAP